MNEQERLSPSKSLFFVWLTFVWVWILEVKFRLARGRKEALPAAEDKPVDPVSSTFPFEGELQGTLKLILIFFLVSFGLGCFLLLTSGWWWKKWPQGDMPPLGGTLFSVFSLYFSWDLTMLLVSGLAQKHLQAPQVVLVWLTQAGGYLFAVSLFRGQARRLRYSPSMRDSALGVFGYWMAFPVVIVGALLLSKALGRPGVSTNPMMEILTQSDATTFVALAVLAVIVGPLFEEFLFRGILYRQLRESFGPWKAAFVSAFFFAVVHVDLMATLPLFCLGVVFARVYEKSGTLWSSFLCHLLWNLGTVVVLYTLTV